MRLSDDKFSGSVFYSLDRACPNLTFKLDKNNNPHILGKMPNQFIVYENQFGLTDFNFNKPEQLTDCSIEIRCVNGIQGTPLPISRAESGNFSVTIMIPSVTSETCHFWLDARAPHFNGCSKVGSVFENEVFLNYHYGKNNFARASRFRHSFINQIFHYCDDSYKITKNSLYKCLWKNFRSSNKSFNILWGKRSSYLRYNNPAKKNLIEHFRKKLKTYNNFS